MVGLLDFRVCVSHAVKPINNSQYSVLLSCLLPVKFSSLAQSGNQGSNASQTLA